MSVQPMGCEWLYTCVYLLGGREPATSLANFSFFLITVALLVYVCRRWLSSGAAFLLAAVYASVPLMHMETGMLFIENLLVAFVFGAIIAWDRFRQNRQSAYLYIAAICLGGAMSTKVLAAFFVIAIAIFLLYDVFTSKAPPSWATIAIAIAFLLTSGSVPYLYAWWKVGNPVFPYMNSLTSKFQT